MAPSVATKDQTFSFEVVSCLLAILANSKVTLGDAHFALMEKYEGSTTKSGYQHRFRAVKARAKEINEEVMKAQSESDTTPVKPKAKARVQSKTPSTAGSKRKARSEYPGTAQPSNEDDEEEVKTPSKKAKSEQDEYFE